MKKTFCVLLLLAIVACAPKDIPVAEAPVVQVSSATEINESLDWIEKAQYVATMIGEDAQKGNFISSKLSLVLFFASFSDIGSLSKFFPVESNPEIMYFPFFS